MKTIIVFGATGTVGAYTCLHLARQGYKVIAVGRRSSDNHFFEDYGIEYLSVDIIRNDAFKKLPREDVYGIVNLAGMLPARMEGYTPQTYIDTNMTGMLNILQYAADAHVQRFAYSQSISDVDYLCGSEIPVNADAPSRFPLDNDHSIYSITKNAASDMLRHYAHHYNMRYFILRFPNIYLYHPNPYYYVDGVLRMQGYRRLIYQAMRGEDIEIWGDPERMRDMVYVKDCTQIISLCFDVEDAESGVYNVGTGIGTTLKEQITGIIDVFSPADHPSAIHYRPEKNDAPQYIFDISKTKKNLGYQPHYSYIEYLKDFKKEMLEQNFSKLWGHEKDYI